MRKNSTFLKVFMTIVTCLFCMQTAFAGDDAVSGFGGGYGTSAKPYLIKTAQHLKDLAHYVNDGETFKGKYFKMTNDIAVNNLQWDNGDRTKAPANLKDLELWTPIGEYGSFLNDYFEGIFDGDGHSISGLVIHVRDHDYTGLFGAVNNAIIRNLTITDSYLYEPKGIDYRKTGMMAAYMRNSQFVNCHVKNSLLDVWQHYAANASLTTAAIGGLIGQCSGSNKSLKSCSFDGTIYITYSENNLYCSGLVAQGAADITNCKTSGTIVLERIERLSGEWHDDVRNMWINGLCMEAGNIVGTVSTMDITEKMKGKPDRALNFRVYGFCENAKSIKQSAYIGSITFPTIKYSDYGSFGTVGNVSNSVEDCAFYCKFKGEKSDKSRDYKYDGIFDYESKYYPFYIEKGSNASRVVVLDCDEYFSTDIEDFKKVSPTIDTSDGKNYVGDVATLSADGVMASLNSQSTGSTVWGTIDNGDFKGCPLPVACGGSFNNQFKGEGTASSPFDIGSETELRALASGVNSGELSTEGKYFALTSNIDMSSSDEFTAIGTDEHPFLGNFDGSSYAISGIKLKNGLFGTLGGRVSRLAIIGAELDNTDLTQGVIVNRLGDKTGGSTAGTISGTLSECYVGGDITVKGQPATTSRACIGALCGQGMKGEISDCYFKGRIIVDNGSTKPSYIGGLVGQMREITVKNSYASFEASGDGTGTLNVSGLAGERDHDETTSIDMGTIADCFFMCDQAKSYDGGGTHPSGDKVTQCRSDKEILDQFSYDSDSWEKGAYRPVLGMARSYKATAADGGNTEVWLDAIPLADSKNPSNDIYHYRLNYYNQASDDNLVWAVPNLAVFNEADLTEYILNCTLDPSQQLNYNKHTYWEISHGTETTWEVKSVKVNMHYPLALTKGQNYYPLCLPGTVGRDNLPDGGRLLIGGKVLKDGSQSYINVVEADSVEAGVPFFVYLPSSVTDGGGTADIVMRSEMALKPLTQIAYGDGHTQEFDLTGTFAPCKAFGFSTVKTSSADNKQYLSGNAYEHKPFTAYLKADEGSTTGPELRDYLLLDDNSNETDKVLDDNSGSTSNVRLERALSVDKWNTLCLPFSMTAEEVESTFGQGTKVEKLTSVETDNNGGCTLKFGSTSNGIECGVAYLIKPANSGSSYTLLERTISGSNSLKPESNSVSIDGKLSDISFCGTFARKMLGHEKGYDYGEDKTEEYFIQGNTILHVGDDQLVAMNGFRAYITASKAAAKALAKARIVHGDGSVTGLTLIEAGSTADGPQRVFNLQGMEQNAGGLQQRGVYIKDGRKYVKK